MRPRFRCHTDRAVERSIASESLNRELWFLQVPQPASPDVQLFADWSVQLSIERHSIANNSAAVAPGGRSDRVQRVPRTGTRIPVKWAMNAYMSKDPRSACRSTGPIRGRAGLDASQLRRGSRALRIGVARPACAAGSRTS